MSTPAYLVVGAGRMGGALMTGWVSGRRKSLSPKNVMILDPRPGDAAVKLIAAGAKHLTAAGSDLSTAQVALLAIKPQMFDSLGPEIAQFLSEDCLIISVLAGTNLANLESVFPRRPIIRAMPNTPAAIGAGITAFTGNAQVSSAQRKMASKLLSAGGKVFEVENEHLIDVVTAVSGSGPAYVFHMVEALEAAAIKIGLPEDIAPDFARQTIIGAGALLKKDPSTATELRQMVTSPGGTTQAALDVLMGVDGLPPLMRETVAAALRRAKELGQA